MEEEEEDSEEEKRTFQTSEQKWDELGLECCFVKAEDWKDEVAEILKKSEKDAPKAGDETSRDEEAEKQGDDDHVNDSEAGDETRKDEEAEKQGDDPSDDVVVETQHGRVAGLAADVTHDAVGEGTSGKQGWEDDEAISDHVSGVTPPVGEGTTDKQELQQR
ncbi:hypothetical protein K1719_002407 [Acacia pycnantha]|nr:hypothetical protein K1719_002407 [Acacia pycnantha]